VISLSGNRQFCVNRNEVEAPAGTIRPREQRSSPLITTLGYKYQVAASLRGTSTVTKLFESPVIRTAYSVKEPRKTELPTPRLPTPEDRERSRVGAGDDKVSRWIPKNTCTTLAEASSFPLPPGRYDVYLGFDLLVKGGQWVPLQSDFITDVRIEKDRATRVLGRVDYTDGVRTVKLEAAEEPGAAPVTGSGRSVKKK
jgi:hypothetical protein